MERWNFYTTLGAVVRKHLVIQFSALKGTSFLIKRRYNIVLIAVSINDRRRFTKKLGDSTTVVLMVMAI